ESGRFASEAPTPTLLVTQKCPADSVPVTPRDLFETAEPDERIVASLEDRPYDVVLASGDLFKPVLMLSRRWRELQDQQVTGRLEIAAPFRDRGEMITDWWFKPDPLSFENRPKHRDSLAHGLTIVTPAAAMYAFRSMLSAAQAT